jgi:hypothetical protein
MWYPLIIICSWLMFLFTGGALLLAGSGKDTVWRWSIYIAMISTGGCGFGLLLTDAIPHLTEIAFVGVTLMLGGVFVSYARSVPPSMSDFSRLVVWRMEVGIGLVFLIVLSVSFSRGGATDQQLKASQVNALDALAREVKEIHRTVNQVSREVKGIRATVIRVDQRVDSVITNPKKP